MDSKIYHEMAPKTATLDHQAVLSRMNARSRSLLLVLLNAVRACNDLEQAKKHFLYGKPAGEDLPTDDSDTTSNGLGHDVTERLLANFDLLHGSIGMATEAGELLQQLVGHVFDGQPLDQINVVEELGDISWYKALAIKAAEVTAEQVWDANIAKLRKRYPAGVFDEKFCHERDVEAERRAIASELTVSDDRLKGWPGVTHVPGTDYTLFDVQFYPDAKDLPGHEWVDFFRVDDQTRATIKEKMLETSRYHIGKRIKYHVGLDPADGKDRTEFSVVPAGTAD